MIHELLPVGVSARERIGPGDTDIQLFAQEAAVVARAVGTRRREFAAVRGCARQALAEIGVAAVPLLPGDHGAPQWPPGVVGSMTHCAGYCAAAVARSSEFRGIGIDAEPNRPLPPGVLAQIASPAEVLQLPTLRAERPDVCWDTLLFCVKESVFKVWFPLHLCWLGFLDVTVHLDLIPGSFSIDFLPSAPAATDRQLDRMIGRWSRCDGFLLSAAIA